MGNSPGSVRKTGSGTPHTVCTKGHNWLLKGVKWFQAQNLYFYISPDTHSLPIAQIPETMHNDLAINVIHLTFASNEFMLQTVATL